MTRKPASRRSREESAVVRDYDERHRAGGGDAATRVERAGLGTDCGAHGFTTLEQAERLVSLLGLDRRHRLLDIGSGCAWPSLHLARRSGCRAVATDLPLAGLLRAGERARREGLEHRLHRVRCSARALPFPPRSFDVVVHTDVLC